jgi:hypothetical protein
MTLTIELKPEEEAALNARAMNMGVDMETALRGLISPIESTEQPLYKTMPIDEWEKMLDDLSEDVDPELAIPDEALTREHMYEDVMRWRTSS